MPNAFFIVESAGKTTKVPLEPLTVCRIGRNSDNTIILDDLQVSRYHALVIGTPSDEYSLTNLGSMNGTTLNGVLVNASMALKHGDTVRIGDHQLKFEQETDGSGARPGYFEPTNVRVVQEVVSVLVVDIRDYTGISQRLGAGISDVVGTFLREAGKLLAVHGSWSSKFIGDAVMGVWRHQSSNGVELVSILTALAGIFEVASGLQGRFGLESPIRIGAGINSGPAALGNMGSDAQADFTAIGDVVNKAFRLESATRTLGADIVLGRATYEFLENSPDMSALIQSSPVTLKGYDSVQQAYGFPVANLSPLIEKLRVLKAG